VVTEVERGARGIAQEAQQHSRSCVRVPPPCSVLQQPVGGTLSTHRCAQTQQVTDRRGQTKGFKRRRACTKAMRVGV
jgi:hypothetical protein